MIRVLYDILFTLFAIGYVPLFLIKGKHRSGLGTRLGALPLAVQDKMRGKKVIWIHAVSVGEVQVASRFFNKLKEDFNECAVLLTVTTMTGYEVAQKIPSGPDALCYFPIDLSFCVSRFIKTLSPAAVIILETEIWPNLIWELHARKIPVVILNGRISDKAIGAYRRFRFFFKQVLNCLNAVAVQEATMRQRFIEAGADPQRVLVTGNVKFDFDAPTSPSFNEESVISPKEILVVCGSTHEGEERMVFEAAAEFAKTHPEIRWVIAPRHLERLVSIESDAAQLGVAVKRIDSTVLKKEDAFEAGTVCVLNQMGVLSMFYARADIVFVGGSLVPTGGHNLVEAAYFQKPVLFGPYMQNFRQMAKIFIEHKAAIQVASVNELKSQVITLAGDALLRKDLGLAAKKLVESQKGAVERNIEVLRQVMEKSYKN